MQGTTFSSLFEFAGLVGVIVYIGAYGALQLGVLRGNGYAYALANLLASSLVLVSLTTAFNLSSAIIQIVWIVISTVGLARMYLLDRRARLNDEERAFIARKFPTMPRASARAFLNAGAWHEAGPGTRLATEGQRLGALIYLAKGEADILSGARVIARCPATSFVGELTCFDGGPASTTVELATEARYFSISAEALNRLCAGDFGMRQILHRAVGHDVRDKLIEANRRLRESPQSQP